MIINRRESTDLKHLNDSTDFIEYPDDMDNINTNIEEYYPNKKRKILIVFDDMISDMLLIKKSSPIATELLMKGRKLTISLVFITQSYFAAPKGISVNSTNFIMKILNKRELQRIAFNHSSDIDFRDFMNLYKNHFLFYLLTILLHQIIIYFLKKLF